MISGRCQAKCQDKKKSLKCQDFYLKKNLKSFNIESYLKTIMKRNTQISMYKHLVQRDIAFYGNSIRYKFFVAKLHSKRLNWFTYSIHCMSCVKSLFIASKSLVI